MKYWGGVALIILVLGCTSTNFNSSFEHVEIDIKQPVRYTPTGINGYVESNQEICEDNGKTILMLFGKAGNVWTDEALRIIMESVKDYSKKIFFEQWTSNVPADRDVLFKNFNPTKSYPTIIVGCKYVKVGSGGDHNTNVRELKQILSLATS
ncbi:MAG: hypothetical protein GON13_04025 [Nanoarchaeota archaeon]|nr:hypothetical protein [Nanoarchaeota archaeon]